MPRMGGYEALKEIRGDDEFRLIPIIIFTTSTDKQKITEGYELGANAVVVKPNVFDELKKAVKAVSEFWVDVAELPETGT